MKVVFAWKSQTVLALCLALTAACVSPGGKQGPARSPAHEELEKGESFFSGWSMKSAIGPPLDLGEAFQGDVALVSFFATYCTRCKQKLVDHQALHEQYSNDGLLVLGVSVDEPETQSDVGAYVRSRRLTFPVVIDTDSRLVDQLNPRRTLPFSVIVDRAGKVLWSHVGYAPGDEKLFESRVLDALTSFSKDSR